MKDKEILPNAEELLSKIAAQNPELIIAKAIELDPENVASEAIYKLAMEREITSTSDYFDFDLNQIDKIASKARTEMNKKYFEYLIAKRDQYDEKIERVKKRMSISW